MFGIRKKAIIGFVLLNVIIFGSIGYFGIQIDQKKQDNLTLLDSNVLPNNRQITDKGDIFWVTTEWYKDNDNGSIIVEHILHRLTPSMESMDYILFVPVLLLLGILLLKDSIYFSRKFRQETPDKDYPV